MRKGLGVYSGHLEGKLDIRMRDLSHGNTNIHLSVTRVWVVVHRPTLSW
jgi:hypothetical protein